MRRVNVYAPGNKDYNISYPIETILKRHHEAES